MTKWQNNFSHIIDVNLNTVIAKLREKEDENREYSESAKGVELTFLKQSFQSVRI
jgi:hypothetical protein